MAEPLSTDEAIALASDLFGQRDGTWARPMLFTLERLHAQCALDWALRLYEDVVPTRTRRNLIVYHAWLDQLKTLMSEDDVTEQCDALAYKIWRNDPTVNLMERGIARMCWARMNFLQSHNEDYIFQVEGSVALLSENDDPNVAMDEAIFERAVGIFRRMVAQ